MDRALSHFKIAKQSRTAAFSLLELMITLAVGMIMLTVGVPAMNTYVQEKRLRAVQYQLQADLNFARHKAVNDNQRAVVCPADESRQCAVTSQWDSGWIVFLDGNGDHQRQPEESSLRVSAGDSRLSIRSHDSRQQVRFSPYGTAPASNASIVFCDQRGLSAGRKLVVSQSGRIRQAMAASSDEGLCGPDHS